MRNESTVIVAHLLTEFSYNPVKTQKCKMQILTIFNWFYDFEQECGQGRMSFSSIMPIAVNDIQVLIAA